MGACDFVVVVLVGIILCGQLPWPCLGLLDMNVKLADSLNRSQGLRIESQYGSALVLPLSGSEANVPLQQRRHHRGRELVADARMTLHDDLLTKGYYTSRVFIGSPSQEFALIVDTGSTVTYVPCSSCTHCGSHQDPRFKPDKSASYEVIKCGTDDCKTGMCDTNKQCGYERMYAEMSSSRGVLGKDQMGFGPDSRLAPQALLFGCETKETGDLYLQHADGIMGLGRGSLSIVDQIVGNGAMADSFSLCYGGMDEGGGAMILGSIPPIPGMVFTSSDPARSNYYNLNLTGIQVQGISLQVDASTFDGKYGTVLDSGTTYAYLPHQAFEAFKEAVVRQLGALQAVDGPDPKYQDICYAGAGNDPKELEKQFPPVVFIFGDGKMVTLAPENYLFKHTRVPGAYCLGVFKNQDATTLLGGIVVRNMLVTYDRSNQQIGFLKTNCSNLWSILPADTSQVSPPPTAQASPQAPQARSPTGTPAVPTSSENPQSPLTAVGSAGSSHSAPSSAPSLNSLEEQDLESVELLLELNSNFTTFSKQTSLFMSDMATELGVLPSQVHLEEFKEEDSKLVVRCIIAHLPDHRLSATSAEEMVHRLNTHAVHLPQVFGTYHLRSWKYLKLSRWSWLHSKEFRIRVAVTALVAVVLLLVASAGLVYWYLYRYRDKAVPQYTNMNENREAEEETLMSDQL